MIAIWTGTLSEKQNDLEPYPIESSINHTNHSNPPPLLYLPLTGAKRNYYNFQILRMDLLLFSISHS